MTERDRETALTRYTRMFDDAESEDELMQQLGSPTKAAICVLRGYVPSKEAPACPEEAEAPVEAPGPDAPPPVSLPEEEPAPAAEAPEEPSPAEAPAPLPTEEAPETDELPTEAAKAEPPAAEHPAWQEIPMGPDGLSEPVSAEAPEPPAPSGRVSAWRVLLYVLLSAVVWLPVAVLLIVLAAAVFGGGAAVIAAGVFTVSLGFTGITAVSDVMLLAGAGVVVAAVGLLAAFFGVWLFVRGAVGFINFAVRGAGWCRVSGEEAAEE